MCLAEEALIVMRRPSRTPLVLAFFIALSGACGGGGDEGTPAEYETKPGPNIPQPPAQRSVTAEGEVEITLASGEVSTVALSSKVEGSTVFAGRESGFNLEMACGETIARVEVSLYFVRGTEVLRIERQRDRWTVDGATAEVVPSRPTAIDAGIVADGGDGDAGDAGSDAETAPPPNPEFVNGLGFPAADGSREVVVTLVEDGVRYDIRATIPWRASIAPATCQEVKPGTGTSGSGGGCGGGKSRRSSGGDWD
jgi:hypothetical protein